MCCVRSTSARSFRSRRRLPVRSPPRCVGEHSPSPGREVVDPLPCDESRPGARITTKNVDIQLMLDTAEVRRPRTVQGQREAAVPARLGAPASANLVRKIVDCPNVIVPLQIDRAIGDDRTVARPLANPRRLVQWSAVGVRARIVALDVLTSSAPSPFASRWCGGPGGSGRRGV